MKSARILTASDFEAMTQEQRELIADVLTTIRFHDMNNVYQSKGYPLDSPRHPEVRLEIMSPDELKAYYGDSGDKMYVEGADDQVSLTNTIHYQDSASGCLFSLSDLVNMFARWCYEQDQEI